MSNAPAPTRAEEGREADWLGDEVDVSEATVESLRKKAEALVVLYHGAKARAAQAEAGVAELKHRYEHCDENFSALMQIFNWAVQHDEFAVKHEGGPDAAALNVTDLADSFKARAAQAEAEVARLTALMEAMTDALEPLWQRARTLGADTVPDDGRVTVFMLDCRIADRVVRTALEAPHADK